MHPATEVIVEFVVKLALSALVALAVWWLDEPLFSVNLAWWVCALIGLVIGFGGWVVIVNVCED